MAEFLTVSTPEWVKQFFLQSPALLVVLYMWYKENKRGDKLLQQLLETQASTIETLVNHKNLLELIREEVRK